MEDEDYTASEGSYVMIQNPDAPTEELVPANNTMATEATAHSEQSDDVERDGTMSESEDEGLPPWKDRLLDSFPFQQAELERLCLYYEDLQEFRFARLAEQTQTQTQMATKRGALLEWIEAELLPDQFAQRVMTEAMELAVVPQESFSPFATIDTTAPTDLPQRKLFLEAVAGGTGRRSPRMVLKIIHACCCYHPEKDNATVGTVANATQLIALCYRIAMACHLLQQDQTTEEDLQTLKAACMEYQTSIPTSLVDSLIKQNGGVPSVSVDTFVTWAEATAPHLAHVLSTFLYLALSLIMKPKCTFSFPHLGDTESTFIKNPIDSLGFTFACMDPRLSRKWHRLYTTEADGMAFTQIKMALIGYGGPTVLLIRPTTGKGAFGYFTTSFWKESRHFYGDSDSFLFRAEPTLGVYRALRDTEEDTYPDNNSSSTQMLPSKTQYKVGRNYMYLNTSTRSVIPDQLPHGICFGGTHTQPRLQLNESFENCTALVRDETYEEGPLLADDWDLHFDIDVLEVWGLGSSEEEIQSALELGHKQRAIMESTLARSQHVDKTKFLDLFQTGLIPNAIYEHRETARGHHSFAINDDQGGYKMDTNDSTSPEISPLDPIASGTYTHDNKGELPSGCFDDP